jgi:hypothetical protein
VDYRNIEKAAQPCGGQPAISGTRIRDATILTWYQYGMSVERARPTGARLRLPAKFSQHLVQQWRSPVVQRYTHQPSLRTQFTKENFIGCPDAGKYLAGAREPRSFKITAERLD